MSVNTYDKDTKETIPVAGSAKITLDSEPTQGSNNAISSGGVYNTVQNLNSKGYQTSDSASTAINDTDYIPMSNSSGTKKKTLWSTIIAKVKAALATVATSGSYSDLTNKPSSFTPSSHASTGTGYGAGTISNYGHVKLTDSYKNSSYHPGGNSSVGASADAVYSAYSELTNLIDEAANVSSWLPSNGYNPIQDTSPARKTRFFAYSVNPNQMVYQGCPTNFSSYGTVLGVYGPSYPILIYIDVSGNLAIWSTNENVWKKF